MPHLKERGTLAAVEAIAEIARAFPQEDWLKWMIPEAQEILLRQSWIPYSQSYVRDFIINREKNQSPIVDKKNERRDEIIHRLKIIEFGISRLSLSSGNARQNLIELQAELELIKNNIKSKDKSVEKLRVDLGDISSPIVEELERTKSALIVALEEHSKSHQDLNDLVSVQGAAVQSLKQSKARDILGLTADVASLIGLAFSILSTLKP
jgi:archaellum component FlaC